MSGFTIEQMKAIRSLKSALKKCSDAGVGVGMEDFSIYVADYYFVRDNYESAWDFLRDKNSDDDFCLWLENEKCLGAGGA